MVSKKLSLFLGLIFLVGMVSAWSVDITKLNGAAIQDNYSIDVTNLHYQLSEINCSQVSDILFSNDNGATNISKGGCSETGGEILLPNLVSVQGDNDWMIIVKNIDNTTESDSVSFWVDSIFPVINWIIPSTNPIAWASDTINLQIFYIETNPKQIEFGIYDSDDNEEYYVRDKILPLSTSISKSGLTDNDYMCSVILTDTIGHSTTINTTVYIDNVDPVASIDNPGDGTLHNEDVSIETSATDDRSGVERIEIRVDGSLEETCYSDTCDYLLDSTALADGFYGVDATAYDNAGNSNTDSITIEIDNTAPVLTLIGANPQYIEVFDSYSELGATSLDARDGDLSAGIIIDAIAVNTNVLGDYDVVYYSTDEAGNTGSITRTVYVQDTIIPVITLVGDNPQEVEYNTAYTELGATALDNYDGDISASIVIDASDVDTTIIGSYVVTYDVQDSSGNPAITETRTVDVVDTTPPVITLLGDNPQIIQVGDAYVEAGATAEDNYDGDLTWAIIIDASAVDTSIVGDYEVYYTVTDSFGNYQEITRDVNVVDDTAPVITLLGANPQTIERLDAYTELGATALDNYDGDLTLSIVIDASDVDTSIVGDYDVVYYVEDSNGNSDSEIRIVHVEDTTAPEITVFSPVENLTYIVNDILLQVSANEESTWKYSLDDGLTNNTFTPNITINLANGDYNLIVYAVDEYGNENSSVISFNVDHVVSTSSSGSCKTIFECTEWSDWSECIDGLQTRECLDTKRVSCGEGNTSKQLDAGETRTCVIQESSSNNQRAIQEGEPIVVPEQESQGFFGRITGGVVGFAKSGTGIVTIITLLVLSGAYGFVHYKRKHS